MQLYVVEMNYDVEISTKAYGAPGSFFSSVKPMNIKRHPLNDAEVLIEILDCGLGHFNLTLSGSTVMTIAGTPSHSTFDCPMAFTSTDRKIKSNRYLP